MSISTQNKFMAIAEDISKTAGLELVVDPQYSNTGSVRFERKGVFQTVFRFTYNFQDRYASFGGDLARSCVKPDELDNVIAQLRYEVGEAADAAGLTCRCGEWPISEYGEVCPSCVIYNNEN